jgi:hypothetical protein
VVDHGFKTRSGQTKDYKIGICCFSANLRSIALEANMQTITPMRFFPGITHNLCLLLSTCTYIRMVLEVTIISLEK